MIKKVLLALVILLVVIQAFRPKKNINAQPQPYAMHNSHIVPEDVKSILGKACMDCHSNNTRYPWYNNIQPLAWWLADHVKEGKGHLNFDEYTNKSLRFQYHKMEEVVEMVEKGEMPLKSYTWTHGDARLNVDEKQKLISWANSVMDAMKAKHPIDSLIRKK
jgi:hypothetical protein